MRRRSQGPDPRELCHVKEAEPYVIGTGELLGFRQGYNTIGLKFKQSLHGL